MHDQFGHDISNFVSNESWFGILKKQQQSNKNVMKLKKYCFQNVDFGLEFLTCIHILYKIYINRNYWSYKNIVNKRQKAVGWRSLDAIW